MNAQQRYFFDLTGFLHLESVLTKDQLAKARAAAEKYINTPTDQLPVDMGLEIDRRRYTNSFAFHKDLETLATLPAMRKIIGELTYGKPRLTMGTLMRVKHDDNRDAHSLHSAGDEQGRDKVWLCYEDGKLRSNNFAVFVYLTDVFPGDGGVILVSGSHKSNCKRDKDFFGTDSFDTSEELPPPIVNITPKAGDVLVMPEALTHGALPWQPEDRERWVVILRYGIKDTPMNFKKSNVSTNECPPYPEKWNQTLSPETLELVR